MRYPPRRAREPRHCPAHLRGAREIHLVHAYGGQEPWAPGMTHPLLTPKLCVAHRVAQCGHVD